MSSVSAERAFRGLPTFFVACCDTAKQGGSMSYAGAGEALYRGTGTLVPQAYDYDEWQEELERLDGLIEAGDDSAVIGWFEERYPRCMALVPARRRQNFLEGVYRISEESY